jgi:drug/metabolite transporter (DMT)-like permease
MTDARTRLIADLACAALAFLWGATFVTVKWAAETSAALPFLTTRFVLATAALAAVGPFRLARLTRFELMAGSLVGVFLGAGYAFQTLGIRHIRSAEAAFLTAVGSLLVPLFALAFGRRPSPAAVAGLIVAAAGIFLISQEPERPADAESPPEVPAAVAPAKAEPISPWLGRMLLVGCATAFALHMTVQGEVAARCDPFRLAVVQLAASAAFNAVCWAAVPGPLDPGRGPDAYPADGWAAVAFLAVFATSLAFVVQAWAQRLTSATHIAIMFSLEPVFAALFGVFLAGETLSPLNWAGAALILGGIVVAEWPFGGTIHEPPPLPPDTLAYPVTTKAPVDRHDSEPGGKAMP